jgi:DHA1 family inner membrane transport protein
MDRRLIVLAVGMFAIGTDTFVIAGILPMVSKSLNVPVAVAGQMVTVFALSFAILAPVMAAVAARWPRKQLLLAGLGIFVLANVLTAMAPTLELVLACRVLAGLGAAMFSPTATATGASLVPAEQRGRALAVVLAGLSSATALGSPIGTVIGGSGDWRITMWFVAALGVLAALGIWILLPKVPSSPVVSLRKRLAPLTDSSVALTLLTTFAIYCGVYVVYTYISVAFDRATGGNGALLAGLLFLWGVAATIGNLTAGRLTDRFGSTRVINVLIVVAAIDFILMPWTSAYLSTAMIAIIIWGLCGWGLVVPQQHRLIGIAPTMAPLLLGLNTAALNFGVSASGVIGAAGVTYLDKYRLGLIGGAFIATAFVIAQLAHRRIKRHV